jgi:membrane-associated phospholipid phosphatase
VFIAWNEKRNCCGKINMKKILTVFCLMMAASYGFAQGVYTYDIKKDIAIGFLSIGLVLTPLFVNNEPGHIPVSLETNDVNVFDRPFMFSYNRPLDMASDYGIYGMLVLPAISIIGNLTGKDRLLTYGIMNIEAFLLTFGTINLLKGTIIRYRPYMYADKIPDGKEDDYYNSFPSGSTAYAFLGATFLSTTFSREYSESKWKLPVIIGSYTLAAGIASMRILSGSHFLSDVFIGAAIGSLYGWLIPALHIKNDNKNSLSINFTGNGMLVSLSF